MENNSNARNKVVFDFQSYHTPVTRAMYVGVFLGFVSAIVNIAYWSIFINMTALGMSSYIVNVQTISFGSILPLVTCGALYSVLTHYLGKTGAILNSIIFAVAALSLILVVYNGDYGNTIENISLFKALVIPILLIIGLSATIVFPICFKSKKVENMML